MARLNTVTGVKHAALFQNFLELTVFAESSVDGVERKIDIFRKRKVFITNIDFDNFCTHGAKRFRNAATGRQRHIALGPRAAH
jgi:hypothetical protein